MNVDEQLKSVEKILKSRKFRSKNAVIWVMPAEVEAVLDETLYLDSQSGSFETSLREDIDKALRQRSIIHIRHDQKS